MIQKRWSFFQRTQRLALLKFRKKHHATVSRFSFITDFWFNLLKYEITVEIFVNWTSYIFFIDYCQWYFLRKHHNQWRNFFIKSFLKQLKSDSTYFFASQQIFLKLYIQILVENIVVVQMHNCWRAKIKI